MYSAYGAVYKGEHLAVCNFWNLCKTGTIIAVKNRKILKVKEFQELEQELSIMKVIKV